MTKAKVRQCPQCKAEFTKETGCNKMTCSCSKTMCYLCRMPSISYNHFCTHPRDPGRPCSQCSQCSLWTNPEEDEERAIAEMKEQAQKQREAHGFTEKKEIGAPVSSHPANTQEQK